jgi:hypothetical protein
MTKMVSGGVLLLAYPKYIFKPELFSFFFLNAGDAGAYT